MAASHFKRAFLLCIIEPTTLSALCINNCKWEFPYVQMQYLWQTGVGMTGRKNESGAGKGRSRHEEQDDWWQVDGHAALMWERSREGYAGERRPCKRVTVPGHFSASFASSPLFSGINFYSSQSPEQIHILTSLVCVQPLPGLQPFWA